MTSSAPSPEYFGVDRVTGRGFCSVVTITRPSNTTAYTAGDVVGDTGGSAIIALASIGPASGYVIVQSASLIFSDSSVPSGMTSFRLHFHSASPTAIADNAAFDLTSGERANYIGYIDLPTPQDFGSSLYTQVDYPGRMMQLAAGSSTIYAELQTIGAYTPASASTIAVRVATMEVGL